jgi:hypothetical protein
MGTIIVNGKRFDGNSVTVRDGKVAIDGKPQGGEIRGDVEAQVVEGVAGHKECIASVSCGGVGGDVAAGASVSTGARAGGAIRAVAFASAGNGRGKTTKR